MKYKFCILILLIICFCCSQKPEPHISDFRKPEIQNDYSEFVSDSFIKPYFIVEEKTFGINVLAEGHFGDTTYLRIETSSLIQSKPKYNHLYRIDNIGLQHVYYYDEKFSDIDTIYNPSWTPITYGSDDYQRTFFIKVYPDHERFKYEFIEFKQDTFNIEHWNIDEELQK